MSDDVNRWLLRLLAVMIFVPGLFVECANPMSPGGGPRDTLPPVVVSVSPSHGAVNFDQKKILITFDEYVKLHDQQKEFFTSPFMGRKPSVSLRGRGVQVDIQDTLKENTTYSLNFGSSIRDNNEGNPLNGFRYVFSTGERIDSMIMSGYTADAYRGDSIGNVFILFYPAADNPLGDGYDSTLFKVQAQAVARSFPNGTFLAQNLKPIDYRLYAFQDNNGNQLYEPGSDKVAFLDSLYNPASMPGFNIRFDTIRKYPVAQPQIYFRVFMDEGFRRQYLVSGKRTNKHKIELFFNAPHPEIDTLELHGIESENIFKEYPTVGRDTVILWLNIPPDELSDTIRGRLAYSRHDSINELVSAAQDLTLGWFERPESREEKREREQLEKDIEAAVAEGKAPPRKPNPFNYKVNASSELNPENNIVFEFDYPMSAIDSSRIELIRVDGESIFDIDFELTQDSVNIRKWTLRAPWIADNSYKLMIPGGAFTDIARQQNDTLRSEFKVASPDKFGTLTINLMGKTPQSEYTLQVLSSSNQLIKEVRHAITGSYTIQYLTPGGVKLRVLEDMNGNGVWDRGDLVKRMQPERMEMYVAGNGEEEIVMKQNWDIGLDVDMNILFAPMTMDRLIKELESKEAARMRRYLKEQERQSSSGQRRTAPSNESSSGGASGLGMQGVGNIPGMNR